jgi:hypothetical protein
MKKCSTALTIKEMQIKPHTYNHFGKQTKKLNINLPNDPAIPILGIYLKECD